MCVYHDSTSNSSPVASNKKKLFGSAASPRQERCRRFEKEPFSLEQFGDKYRNSPSDPFAFSSQQLGCQKATWQI